jgi:hypothetical protein
VIANLSISSSISLLVLIINVRSLIWSGSIWEIFRTCTDGWLAVLTATDMWVLLTLLRAEPVRDVGKVIKPGWLAVWRQFVATCLSVECSWKICPWLQIKVRNIIQLQHFYSSTCRGVDGQLSCRCRVNRWSGDLSEDAWSVAIKMKCDLLKRYSLILTHRWLNLSL